jgi:hypothetical protein
MGEPENPYMPPKAVVADVTDDSPRVRPTAVTVALYLIGARMLLAFGLIAQTLIALNEPPSVSIMLMTALAVAVSFALWYFIALGKNWARIVYLVMTIASVLSLLAGLLSAINLPQGVTYVSNFSTRWIATVVLPQLLSIAVVVLLFGPGRSWFRPRE